VADVAPPGWPAALPPPYVPEFADRVVGWLLDLAPSEFRGHEVFRRHPLVLAWAVSAYVTGALQASREAYAAARRELAPAVGPGTVDEVLRALEFEGLRLRRLQREVELVAEALQGRRWQARL
jgi:hypothetical protein